MLHYPLSKLCKRSRKHIALQEAYGFEYKAASFLSGGIRKADCNNGLSLTFTPKKTAIAGMPSLFLSVNVWF